MANDLFTQVAAENAGQSQPQQTQASAPAAQPIQAPSGDIFAQVAANPNDSQPASTDARMPGMYATPGSMPEDSLPSKLTLWAQSLRRDLMFGTELTDIGKLYKRVGGQPLASGQGEGVAEFMGSPILGPIRMTQGASELPQPGRRWQGAKDVIGGALDTATIPGAFVSPEVGELASAGADAALTKTAQAASRNFSLKAVEEALQGSHADIQKSLATATKAIQEDFHDAVRGVFNDTAKEAGVQPDTAESLHDVAHNLSDVLKADAKKLYQEADKAVDGRFQSYQERVSNIRRAIREEVGLDPERDAELQQRLADAMSGHEAAKERLAEVGLDPAIIDKADALWRQAMALSDTGKQIRASLSGLRPDVAEGVKAAEEALSPAKLSTRLNRMYDSGRLQQAIGEDRAQALLRTAEEARQRIVDVANAAKMQAKAAEARAEQSRAGVKLKRTVTASLAAGASVPGVALLKHLLFD